MLEILGKTTVRKPRESCENVEKYQYRTFIHRLFTGKSCIVRAYPAISLFWARISRKSPFSVLLHPG
jgi:hypothetical protein